MLSSLTDFLHRTSFSKEKRLFLGNTFIMKGAFPLIRNKITSDFFVFGMNFNRIIIYQSPGKNKQKEQEYYMLL